MKKRYPKFKRRRVQTTQQMRHTHSTSAGLEDALAVAWDIIHEQDRAIAYMAGRTRKLIEILQAVRAGPHEYQDRPAGRRVTIRKR